ncbi:flagellar protein FlaG [Neobacillus sp. 114]|uniref:flagellar protein FlaG n=1 Tax=Neobacillus sp. 114 TaxID=3048535 RepID=UPI0024C38C40|nr:flagellar protein FlaG [Neobacillus sp. 114]
MQINPALSNAQSNISQSVKNRTVNEINDNSSEFKKGAEEGIQYHKRAEVTIEEINKGLEKLNIIFKPTHLEFQLHETSGKYFVNIVDDHSKEVIKQIPSEEFLEMVAAAKEQNGLLVDERI